MSTRPRATTIKDVAMLAGVSITTVSDVVNGKGRVDPSTRERVLTAVTDAGWRPRRSARALRSGHSGIIALCLARRDEGLGDWLLNADYDMALVAACAAAAVDSDRQLLLAPSPKNAGELARLDVDGVILADPREGDPSLTLLNRAGLPVVTIERDVRRTDGWWVETDSAGSTRMVLDHLAAQGAQRIALITSDAQWAWFEDTSAAYAQWCIDRGVRELVRYIDVDQPRSSAARAVTDLLRRKNRPDAIFALPGGTPAGAMDAIAGAGLAVPDEILLAAGIDSQTLLVSSPTVTAVDLRPIEMARAAVDLLARRVAGEQSAGPTVIQTALVVRSSTVRSATD